MTIRQEMLRIAGRARMPLNETVISFVRSRYSEHGGYRGRGEQGDLYYTVFAMEALLALDDELPAERIEAFLCSFGEGENLDLVHLACLARCWANLPGRTPPHDVRTGILDGIEDGRTKDGGYGTVYHGFLALCAYQDLGGNLPDANALAASVQPDPGDPTPLLAGAAVLLKSLGSDDARTVAKWLLDRYHEEGGFFAIPQAPVPDLLSTATALHALAEAGMSLDAVRLSCTTFVKSLWNDEGGFHGMAGDIEIDCEYTYYGLLALGQLIP